MVRDTAAPAWSHNRVSTHDHPAVAKVTAALGEAGQHAAAAGVRVLPAEVRTAAQAAEALGVPVGAIANSLVFRARTADGTEVALLALTSGAHRAKESRLAELAGVAEVGKADAAFVREHTGQPIGGVAPVGHPEKLVTLVDTALRGHSEVWAAAGHPKSVFPTTFDALVTLTGGTPGDLSGEGEDGRL
ncbi:prolyl-tRNA editing enzyme YbaK/EbsC (Cys-tRNA(Pro) deacylase) [Amycolatopsis echigonensis]|uniref:Prolyl-tRNA editing enzyme YbaK/EbsC (Cys-tRNA(Pro) deacylase) n=1 Tax=Amycolatopsis echigonensis TaxID=2576905 RepID=A0A2N3WA18_9PSEU|nr:prolyl-tRNA editing enzyme YbaK/EbsC (Cys-tRNA(Pro) deacylase) [Amycolatopsis niigatensis]